MDVSPAVITAAPVHTGDVPSNLPIVESIIVAEVSEPTVQYIEPDENDEAPAEELSAEMKELEDRAHAHHVLLSSDAMRHFIAVCKNGVDRFTFLDRVIAKARASYPSEDGWVVLNLSRMQELGKELRQDDGGSTSTDTIELVNTPLGIGSLAEAIVRGDVNAAYSLIEHRPMIALVDATTDLDAVYRKLQGQPGVHNSVSRLLEETVQQLKPKTLQKIILALTSAVDGTYGDEHAAVKIAIMKAVDIVESSR
ncbi:MAG: hypothetical protein AAFO91_19805 [Bacteroidota bacterium]